MIQEANKFSVAFACVCHFIVGSTLWCFCRVGLLSSAAKGIMGRHQHSKIWLKKHHTASVKTV